MQKTKGAAASTTQANAKPFKAQHFNLPTKSPPTKVAAVNFQQGRHIQGSQNWQGSNYTVFRNYSSQWHDRNWWSGHYNRVVFVFGGWYAWNAGYWYPAWGYAPNSYYAYDGPIYGYNNLPPDQVTANVQPRCNSKVIITAKWTVARPLTVRRSQITSGSRAIHDICNRSANAVVTGDDVAKFLCSESRRKFCGGFLSQASRSCNMSILAADVAV